jgi:hypothetical protein
MIAAVKDAVFFEPMPDNAYSTMFASWCEGMNGALETVECMRRAAHHDLKRLVVGVSAGFANGCHIAS